MPTAAERGRDVRRRLVSAAAELIAERGWAAVSTRMVAERAGVAAGLVHYHFSSVAALLTEAAVGVMRETADALGPLLAQAGTPADAVRLLAGWLDGYTGSDPTSVVFMETYLAATRDRQLRDAIADITVEFRDQLGAWLGEHGVPAPSATAAVLGSAIDGLVIQRALDHTLTAEAITLVLTRLTPVEGEDL
ncbi:TetR/AcrR family transcriptional regulator [Actinophytocola sediminis]